MLKEVLEQMFLGQYKHNLDSKGRVIIPARFRAVLNEEAYITQGFDNNLRLLPETAFQTIYQRVTAMSSTDPTARRLRRLIFSSAQKVDLDGNGRILIPQYLRDVAALDDEVIIVGVGEAIEIWSLQAWEEENTSLQDAEANAESFAALDV